MNGFVHTYKSYLYVYIQCLSRAPPFYCNLLIVKLSGEMLMVVVVVEVAPVRTEISINVPPYNHPAAGAVGAEAAALVARPD